MCYYNIFETSTLLKEGCLELYLKVIQISLILKEDPKACLYRLNKTILFNLKADIFFPSKTRSCFCEENLLWIDLWWIFSII